MKRITAYSILLIVCIAALLLLSTYHPIAEQPEKTVAPSNNFAKSGITKNEHLQYKAAVSDLDKALQQNPKDEAAYFYRGDSRYHLNDFAGAVGDFSNAIALTPGNAVYYNRRALAKEGLKDFSGAIKDFNKALQLNPGDAEFYFDRGNFKQHIGDTRGACVDWNKAASLGLDEAQQNIQLYCK